MIYSRESIFVGTLAGLLAPHWLANPDSGLFIIRSHINAASLKQSHSYTAAMSPMAATIFQNTTPGWKVIGPSYIQDANPFWAIPNEQTHSS